MDIIFFNNFQIFFSTIVSRDCKSYLISFLLLKKMSALFSFYFHGFNNQVAYYIVLNKADWKVFVWKYKYLVILV